MELAAHDQDIGRFLRRLTCEKGLSRKTAFNYYVAVRSFCYCFGVPIASTLSKITKLVEADGKTVRTDLNTLATEGLILYMTGNKNSNPGRRRTHPKLTKRGWKTTEATFNLDRTTREAYQRLSDQSSRRFCPVIFWISVIS